MPAKLAKKDQVGFQKGGVMSKYDWKTYFAIEEGKTEGDQWKFLKKVSDKEPNDFDTDVASFRNTASTAARTRGLALHTQTVTDEKGNEIGLILQAYKPTAEQIAATKERTARRAATRAANKAAETASADKAA